MSEKEIVQIDYEPVELFKVLKIANIVGSGGEAKMVIADGMVRLNGETETRKRKKVMSGDVVEFLDNAFVVELGDG